MWFLSDLSSAAAIEEIEQGTDRSVGVIAGAIIDSMLSDLLRREFHRDDTKYSAKVRNEMFNPDGALGSFGSRIGMAYLSGYLTPGGHKDLQNLKNIRNFFAHYTEHNTFATQKIRDLCANFELIKDRVHGPAAYFGGTPQDSVGSGADYVSLHLVDKDSALKEPRGRFICTAKLFCAAVEIFSQPNTLLKKPIF